VKLPEEKKRTALKSYRLSALNVFFKTLPLIFVPIFLARMLSPEIFGLVAVSAVYIGIAQFITTFETGESIIKKELNDTLLHSIFWFNLICGFLSYLILFISTEIFLFISNDILLKQIIKIQAIVLITTSLVSVPLALLKKKLDFYSISISSLLAGILSSIISISLALLGYGVWALVSFYLVNSVVYCFIILIMSGYVPKFVFKVNKIKNIFSFSANLTLTKILSFIERNAARIIISQYLGYAQVGLYSIGNMIVIKPIKSVSQFVNPVFYSLISKQKTKIKENIASNFIVYIQICILLFFPAGIVLIFFSESIILFILGDKWAGVIPIVFIFSFLFFIRPIIKINVEIFKALSLTEVMSKIYMTFTPLYVFAMLFCVQFGLKEVAISYVTINYILAFVSVGYLMKKLDITFFEIFMNIKNILICNALLAIYYGFFVWFDFNNLEIQKWYIQLAVLASGGFIYFFLHFVFPSNAFNHFLQFIMLNKSYNVIKNFFNRSI